MSSSFKLGCRFSTYFVPQKSISSIFQYLIIYIDAKTLLELYRRFFKLENNSLIYNSYHPFSSSIVAFPNGQPFSRFLLYIVASQAVAARFRLCFSCLHDIVAFEVIALNFEYCCIIDFLAFQVISALLNKT